MPKICLGIFVLVILTACAERPTHCRTALRPINPPAGVEIKR
jgi:hypothetical protein